MELGIFSKTWPYKDLDVIFSEMRKNQLYVTQFNMACVGYPTVPASYDDEVIEKIKKACKKYDIRICALSGTFNMIDPDVKKRKEGLQNFEVLCEIAEKLAIPIVTLCTGSKNTESMWKPHPQNQSLEAWEDIIDSMKIALSSAEKHHIILAVETEASNVIDTPEKARKLLDTMNNKHLKIIMDGANLFHPGQSKQMEEILEKSFALLGKDIVLAHAKDLADKEELSFVAAGKGILNFKHYIKLLKEYQYDGPLIMHGLSPEQIPGSIGYLKGVI